MYFVGLSDKEHFSNGMDLLEAAVPKVFTGAGHYVRSGGAPLERTTTKAKNVTNLKEDEYNYRAFIKYSAVECLNVVMTIKVFRFYSKIVIFRHRNALHSC